MKVLSASLCVMAALCLTAQAAPEEQQQQQPLQQQVQQGKDPSSSTFLHDPSF